MKKLILSILLTLPALPVMAQTHDSPGGEEMKKLNFLVGEWKGEGWIQRGPGNRATFKQSESIQSKVDGNILLIEGLGKGKLPGKDEEVVVHNAFATVSYDAAAKAYRFRAFSVVSGWVDAETIVGEKSLIWGFRDPRAGRIRFTIKINESGQWVEIGESSRDDQTWNKFFEMTLQRMK